MSAEDEGINGNSNGKNRCADGYGVDDVVDGVYVYVVLGTASGCDERVCLARPGNAEGSGGAQR